MSWMHASFFVAKIGKGKVTYMSNSEQKYTENIQNCRFAVHKITYSENMCFVTRHFIVLKDTTTNLVIKITDFADYVLYRVTADTNAYHTNEAVLYTTCQFLNYVFFEHYEKYHITTIYDLNWNMFQDYISEYCSTRKKSDGNYPGKASIQNKRAALCIFGEMLCHYHKEKMRFLHRHQFIHTKLCRDGNKTFECNIYQLHVKYFRDDNNELLHLSRDMPLDLADRILKMAEIYEPDLCFPIVLQLYGGLRSGEVCNVRGKDSILGPGIIIQSIPILDKYGNRVLHPQSIQLDLRHVYALRSDGKEVGKIKKKRLASIYGPFVDIVYRYYLKHLELIKDKECEDTKPLMLCKNQNQNTGIYYAQNKADYCDRVKKLFFNYVLPSCENDANPDLAVFYLNMRNHSWGPHALRHWFTVYLIYCGVDDVAELMFLRGDRSPKSASDYIKNKGVIMQTYKKSLQKFGNMINGSEAN